LPQNRKPDSLDYELEYGPLAAYVLDLRSNRRTGDSARILSETQFARFARFLDAQADKDVLIVGLSVPIVHLPRWTARLGRLLTMQANEDFSDRWSTAGHKRDRDRILALLRKHQRANPAQQVFCISGDIHIACAHRILWDDGTPPIVQLVSSGITHQVGRTTQIASKLSIQANRRLEIDEDGKTGARVRLIQGESQSARNPYTRLNLGILELERGAGGRFKTRTSIYGRRGDLPYCVFQTVWSEPRA
jgi:phosphodiesterase/alkaline phosphatase D-like protein